MDNNLQNSDQPIQRVMQVEIPVGDPETIARRHEDSKKRFPDVALDEDEYVVVSVRRHPFGALGILFASAMSFVIVASIWILVCFMPNKFNLNQQMKFNVSLACLAILALSVLAGIIGNSIYKNNKFYVTNERVIQKLVSGLFSHKKQTISLEAIEDISFTQTGILAHMFDFGTVRLSTVGDESTYTFTMVSRPEKQTELLGDLVENSKENSEITEEMMNLGRKLGN